VHQRCIEADVNRSELARIAAQFSQSNRPDQVLHALAAVRRSPPSDVIRLCETTTLNNATGNYVATLVKTWESSGANGLANAGTRRRLSSRTLARKSGIAH
jgi:hypothetical protein